MATSRGSYIYNSFAFIVIVKLHFSISLSGCTIDIFSQTFWQVRCCFRTIFHILLIGKSFSKRNSFIRLVIKYFDGINMYVVLKKKMCRFFKNLYKTCQWNINIGRSRSCLSVLKNKKLDPLFFIILFLMLYHPHLLFSSSYIHTYTYLHGWYNIVWNGFKNDHRVQ